MNQLKSILKSLFVSLALVIGGIGTAAAAGSIGSASVDAAANDGLVAVDQRGSEDTFSGYGSGDDEDDEEDEEDNW